MNFRTWRASFPSRTLGPAVRSVGFLSRMLNVDGKIIYWADHDTLPRSERSVQAKELRDDLSGWDRREDLLPAGAAYFFLEAVLY